MPEAGNESISVFKEKTWGNEDEGEYITDGYSLRGKRAFNKALEGLRKMMKKGVTAEVNGIEFKVLDTRKNGGGLDVEIELADKNSRGIAVLQLFGPNKKKENVVMVRKSKGSDAKYVTILANQIIKPLVRKYLLGDDSSITLDENSDVKLSVSVRGKKVKLIKCPHCEKTSYSGPGLKTI